MRTDLRLLKIIALLSVLSFSVVGAATLERSFVNPPDAARPGVYWYFMDGNLNREAMTADLESMKEVGLGNLVFLEVNIGVPRGPVDFMSNKWQDLFVHAVRESERLGIDITLGSGPGWTGSGGPWVKPEQAMQFLLTSVTQAKGPAKFDAVLPVPQQHPTPWGKMYTDFYEDVFVFAFPKCDPIISDINEKALYDRYPYTSWKGGVKEFLPAPANFDEPSADAVIAKGDVIDISTCLDSDGRLQWDVPRGEWTIVRMARRATCASTRPAPKAGIGLECDKFDTAALDHHFANYYGKLLKKVGPRKGENGWRAVHIDSWEMGSQNWTKNFLAEFKARRGYDAKPYLLAYSGRALGSLEESERFLWDIRITSQELVLENHAGHLKKLGHQHGFELSIEPYDMNPCADLDLGAVADVPMCEFWGAGYGFDSSFSCIESTSIAHTMGRPIVSAEAFTGQDQWRQYPGSMKNQGDWAFAMGINRFVYHTFAHKPLGDEHRPGMTMGPYGVHWDRGQTWWPMAGAYHAYVTRCSHLLRQGVTVSDILYLTPEGAPHVFRAPASALNGKGPLADKKGYGFDGCSPNILMDRAEVKRGRIVFPGGTSYRLLVLPRFDTMTPRLLEKMIQLVKAGAVVYGAPPSASPSLSGYPECDARVQDLAARLWGKTPKTERKLGKGRIILDQGVQSKKDDREQDKPLLPQKGTWIWFDRGNPARSAAPGEVYFRYTWDISHIKSLAKAKIEATADNAFTLEINGREVLTGDNFNVIYSADILPVFRQGKNRVTVTAHNASNDPNPAGFIAAIQLSQSDGSKQVIVSDQTWDASADGENWSAAKPLGPGPMGPWNLKATPAATDAVLYPEYATTAAVLDAMDVAQDFQSDGPVRYGHRRTDAQDIYFIANTSNEKVQTTCTFRVRKGAPQLWDPVTADMRVMPQFIHEGMTTLVPITFEPHQSFFVMFSRKGSSKQRATAGSVNFPTTIPVGILEGAWDVSFEPKWGGPDKLRFDTLHDWTSSKERGIKYYSGIATYGKTFDCPQGSGVRDQGSGNRGQGAGVRDQESGVRDQGSGQRVYLDLGTVHDMARVRLNGKDLGVVWCAPWRVDITEAVKAQGNVLEIEIANRWPNRLLGDQQAPDKHVRTVKWDSGFLEGKEYRTGRYTFTTNNAPGKLLPSGLIGPVQLMVNQE